MIWIAMWVLCSAFPFIVMTIISFFLSDNKTSIDFNSIADKSVICGTVVTALFWAIKTLVDHMIN